jgi:hypothetical protein
MSAVFALRKHPQAIHRAPSTPSDARKFGHASQIAIRSARASGEATSFPVERTPIAAFAAAAMKLAALAAPLGSSLFISKECSPLGFRTTAGQDLGMVFPVGSLLTSSRNHRM